MAEQAGSISLTCIDMLYDRLLPMLDPDDKTQLASTWQYLRELVRGHVKHLQLDSDLLPTSSCSSSSSSDSVQRHISHVPEFFNSFQSVGLEVNSEAGDTIYDGLLPALSRLPALSSLSLSPSAPEPSPSFQHLLDSTHAQAPNMQALSLNLAQRWNLGVPAWQALGSWTQLTKLTILMPDPSASFEVVFTSEDLQQLSSLRHLRDLELRQEQPNEDPDLPLMHLDFLQQLDVLRSLLLVLPAVGSLASVSSCTKLETLILSPRGMPYGWALDAQDSIALGQLVDLHKLRLTCDVQPEAWPDLRKSVEQMPQFGDIGPGTGHDWLPLLTTASQLSSVNMRLQGPVDCTAWHIKCMHGRVTSSALLRGLLLCQLGPPSTRGSYCVSSALLS